MTPVEMAKTILVNAKDHPWTTVCAMIALAMLGGGKMMTESNVEPWGTALSGIGAIVVIVLGFVARDPKKPPPDSGSTTGPPA